MKKTTQVKNFQEEIFILLKDERKRLALNQDEFAALAGVTRRAYAEWEAGNTSPTAAHLFGLAAAGADIGYIVTGVRSVTGLTPSETSLVDNYRHSSEEGQDAIKRAAFALAQPQRSVKSKAA
jgi:transcriptional regulator with XRE-family HTH domain